MIAADEFFKEKEYERARDRYKAVLEKNSKDLYAKKQYDSCVAELNRLPTEAEWEFASRGGNYSRGYKFSGSNNMDSVAWHWKNSKRKTHVIGSLTPNELGIYDMNGNIWEWCSDLYGLYNSAYQTNPKGASSGSRRVRRGAIHSYKVYIRVLKNFLAS